MNILFTGVPGTEKNNDEKKLSNKGGVSGVKRIFMTTLLFVKFSVI